MCVTRSHTAVFHDLLQNKMSQRRRIPRHFVISGYPNGAPEEETYSNLQTIPDTTEQMELNIRYHTTLILLLSSTLTKYKPPDFGEDFAKPNNQSGYSWKWNRCKCR